MGDDKAGQGFWDNRWTSATEPGYIDPTRPGAWNHVNRTFHRLLARRIGTLGAGSSVLEIGCARSYWLPYFAREFGMTVRGIDYSPDGCEQARDQLRAAGVVGEVVLADLFSPPDELVGAQDSVVSFGVVEHFEDTAGVVAAIGRFLRPGGTIVSTIPNITGLAGSVVRRINRAVYDVHVPLDAEQLASAHRAAGLEVIESGYLVSSNFGIVNLLGIERGTLGWHLRRVLIAVLLRISVAGWWLEDHGVRLPVRAATAGFAYCVARRPSDGAGLPVRP